MCKDKKVKRVNRQKAAVDTAAVSACKLGSSKSDTVSDKNDDQDEKDEKKYVFAIRVVNATTGEGINKVKVLITINQIEYPYRTNSKGRIRLPAKEGGIKRDLRVSLREGSNYTVKGSGHSVTSQEAGGRSTRIELEKQMLEIKSLDDHFVPTGKADAENLEIKYAIAKIASILPKPDVFLCISCDQPVLGEEVYKYKLKDSEIADGSYMLKWDGKANCQSGPYKDKLVNPLCGPLEVKLKVRQGGSVILESNLMKTQVLYHSIKLREASWLEYPGEIPQKMTVIPLRNDPANWVKYLKWVQYRLNILGYFAGPVNGTENAQTKRAIKRYTYEMIDMPETDDPRNAKFAHSLSGEKLKVDLFEEEGVITDPGSKSKIFIQHNYFFHTAGQGGTSNWNLEDGHYDKENNYADPKGGKLDRFEYPIEAKVTLISRTDATGDPDQSAGIDAPEAMGEVKIKWTIVDPPEDFSNLPRFYGSTSPTWAKKFVQDVNANVLALGGGDNCPEQCGGVKSTDFYFERLIPQIILTQGESNKSASTSIYNGGANPVSDWQGKSAVLFKGSNIGGDNFQVEAFISFEGLSNKDDLIAAHAKGRTVEALKAKTGEMTVWRLHRVACGVEWHDLNIPAIDWNSLKPAYEAGFCMLDTTSTTSNRVSEMLANPHDFDPFYTLLAEAKISKYDYYDLVVDQWVLIPGIAPDARQKVVDEEKKQLATLSHIDDDCIFPYKVTKGPKEAEAKFRLRIGQLMNDLRGLVTRITTGNETDGSIGDFFAALNNKTKRPGIISLRTVIYKGFDTVDVTTQKVLIFNKKIKTPVKVQREEGSACVGVGGGAIFIGGERAKQLKDDFLIAHEVGHLFYLSHPWQKRIEHDSNDDNCTMWYLFRGGEQAPLKRQLVDLKPGSQNKSHFCGKCLLKLRGWKINSPGITVIPQGVTKPTGADIIPINPQMQFVAPIKISAGEYTDTNGQKRNVDCVKFIHEHKLTWESSSGDLNDLQHFETREEVHYDKPTQGDPFMYTADQDQHFGLNGGGGESGVGGDDHSVTLPSILCKNPRVAGKITAVQKYQYRKRQVPGQPKDQWKDIPEAIFLLEKEVLQENGIWVFRFCKSNGPGNPIHYKFEVKYAIGNQPAHMPERLDNPDYVPLGAPPKAFVGVQSGVYYKSGQYKIYIKYADKFGIPATDEELRDNGFLGYTLSP